jgi:hypothetical protein
MRHKLKALTASILLSVGISVQAQSLDLSLSSSGWVSGGNTGATQSGNYMQSGVGVQSATGAQTVACCGPNTWVISPYTGSTMLGMQPSSTPNYSTMTSALGLSADSVTALNAQVASQGGSITSAAWISKDFTFQANTQFKMAWVYTSTDYEPFNDGSITTLVNNSSATTLGKINGVSAQYILLGATNTGTGNYSTGSYGSTGWQWVNYDVTTAGTYKLGFAIFNQGDTALSPVLFVNDGLGGVTKNGTSFNPVAPNDPNMPTTNPDGSISTGGGGPVTPTPPTVVSTANGTPIVASSSSNGQTVVTPTLAYGATAVAVEALNSKGAVTPKTLTVTQTTTTTATTPFTITYTSTTPVTTTTVTTPTIVKTWSDGTTTTENGTPETTTSTVNQVTTQTVTGTEIDQAITAQDYQTRVDQYAKLAGANNKMNESFESDPLSRIRVDADGVKQRDLSGRDYNFYISGTGLNSNRSDSYKYDGSSYNIGIEKVIDPTTLLGIAYSKGFANMNGENAAGNINKDAVSIYGVKAIDNWIIKGDVGYAVNDYATMHSLPELGLGNTSTTKGTDKWAQAKLYAPDYNGIRPLVGVRVENNRVNAVTESGSEVSAMTYDAVNQTKTTGLAGVRYDHNFTDNWAVNAEATRNTANQNTASLGVTYHDDKNSSVQFKVTRQEQNGVAVMSAGAQVRLHF